MQWRDANLSVTQSLCILLNTSTPHNGDSAAT